MKILPISDSRNTCGTSFHNDTILASANEICDKLDTDITCYNGDKTHFEFDLELEDGTPFTLYDWKEGDWVDEDTKLYYHIGARNEEDSHKVLAVLKEHGLKTQKRDTSNISVDVAQLMRFLGR
jgi:hypothetical protein